MKKLSITTFLIACIAMLWTSCGTTPPYRLGESSSAMMGENALRYGSMAGAGVGGYYLGESVLGGTAGGAAGAAAGVGLAYMANKWSDNKRMEAFQVGRQVGAQEAREEQLNEKWKREAVYGLPSEELGWGRAPKMRNVYVPPRTINGVVHAGGNQQVMVP